MPGGPKALWTGIMLDGRHALVAVDAGQPRLRVQPVGENGWQAEETFPLISGVRGLTAAQAQPGKLLLWIKDATDLYTSVWENNRMTYPAAMPQSAETADRAILALGAAGTTAWWVQRVGADLDLYVWDKEQIEPQRTRFAGQGIDGKSKAERVVWLGGKRLLVQPSYSNSLRLLTVDDAGKVTSREPANLVKVDLAEFGIYHFGGATRLGRLTDGVLQWLNDDMQPTDQVMLPDGQKIASFVPLPDGTAWALEQGGGFVHFLKPDEAGILRVAQRKAPRRQPATVRPRARPDAGRPGKCHPARQGASLGTAAQGQLRWSRGPTERRQGADDQPHRDDRRHRRWPGRRASVRRCPPSTHRARAASRGSWHSARGRCSTTVLTPTVARKNNKSPSRGPSSGWTSTAIMPRTWPCCARID